MEEAIKNRDFTSFAQLACADSNQFHAVCLDTSPPIFYMNDTSHRCFRILVIQPCLCLYFLHWATEFANQIINFQDNQYCRKMESIWRNTSGLILFLLFLFWKPLGLYLETDSTRVKYCFVDDNILVFEKIISTMQEKKMQKMEKGYRWRKFLYKSIYLVAWILYLI